MTSEQVHAALGGSVIGAELKGDLSKAEAVAVRQRNAADGPLQAALSLDLAIVRLLKGDLSAAQEAITESKANGAEAGQALRTLTYENLEAQILYNYFPSGTGGGGLELTCRWNATAHAEWLADRWQPLFDRERGTPDAAESLVLHRLFGLLLTARSLAAGRRRTGGDPAPILNGVMPAILSIAETDGVAPSAAAYAKRAAATVSRDVGDHGRAQSFLGSAIEAYADAGDQVGQAICLVTRGDWLAAPFSSPLPLDFAAVESNWSGSELDWKLESAEARREDVDVTGAMSAYSAATKLLDGETAPRARAALHLRESYLATVEENFAAAFSAAQTAAQAFAAAGDRFGEHVAIAHAAHARVGAGDIPEDAAAARTIGEWGRDGGSFSYALGIGLVLGRAGRNWLMRRDDYERALACYRLAQELFDALDAPCNEIQSVIDQAKAYRAVGESKTATAFFQDALGAIANTSGSRPGVERDLRRRELLVGLDLWVLALQERDPTALQLAATSLKRALASGPVPAEQADAAAALTAQDLVERTTVHVPLYEAQAARDRGDDAAAGRLFDAAMAAANALSSPRREFLHTVVLATQRKNSEALAAFRRAEAIPEDDDLLMLAGDGKAGEVEERNRLEHRASLLTRIGAYAEASACFEELEQLAGAEWWAADERPWTVLADRAEAYEGLRQFEQALRQYDHAIEHLEARGRLLARDELRTALAGSRSAQHVYFQAARAALHSAESASDPAHQSRLCARGFAYAEQGKARALLDLMAGSAAISSDGSEQSEPRRRWRQLNAEVTLARWQLADHRSGPAVDPSFVAQLEQQVAGALASLRSTEALLSEKEPGFLQVINPRTSVMALEEVAGCLDTDTVLLQYLLLGDELLGWAITNKGMTQFHRAEVVEGRLAFSIDALRQACESRGNWQETAAELSETFLTPFAGEIDARGRMVIVPYGVAHELPFHVLPWRGEPLVAGRAVAVLPSASSLRFVTRDGTARSKPSVLAVGNPAGMEYRRPGHGVAERQRALPGAGVEAEWVAAAFPGSRALIGKDATEAEVRRQIGRHSILHFATHGVLEQAPLRSSLLLANGDTLTVYELLGLDLTTELVVLSACRTGLGTATGGDEVVGLTRALLAGGAKAAVVSLWPVDDVTTSIFMRDFYLHLEDGPAEAMRHAQEHVRRLSRDAWRREAEAIKADVSAQSRHVLDGASVSTLDTSHPYYWAPFVFVGA